MKTKNSEQLIYTGINHTASSYQISRQLSQGLSLILVPESRISKTAEEIAFFTGREVLEFPHFQNFGPEDLSLMECCFQRMYTLSRLFCGSENPVIVSSVKAMLRKTVPRGVLGNFILQFSKKSRIERSVLLEKLVLMGYSRKEKIEEPGEFAIRGDIADIYPPFSDPVRLDFFDDEIEKIYRLNLSTQLSSGELVSCLIFPLTEAAGSQDKIRRILETSDQGEDPVFFLQQNFDLLYEPVDSFSWFETGEIFLVEPDEQRQMMTEWISEKEKHPFFRRHFLQPVLHRKKLSEKKISQYSALGIEGESGVSPYQGGTSYRGKIDFLVSDLKSFLKKGCTVMLTARTGTQKLRIHDILSQHKLAVREIRGFSELISGFVNITLASLEEGFVSEENRLVVIPESEIFGARLEKFHSQEKYDLSPVSHFSEIKEGDLIVHIQHGIGRYKGVLLMDVGGEKKDMIQLEYAGNDKLYIPVENILHIQKYIGAAQIALDRLGSGRFSKARAKAREAAGKFARELIRIYALRSTKKGHAFSSDTVWQEQMEGEFPYPETKDQLTAVETVKRDMENVKPMDRLICGDVGFGKTEVALRAAFKAAIEGKQVAILAPTTILCLQHGRVFGQRLSGYPLKMDLFTRMTPSRREKEILDELSEGRLDLVIGTHKLLQKGVKFKDLGLLIIDEEQRFGVKHKEMLRNLKETVDTITMTATPIPRTLNMSLSGLVDISMITTPPPNRKAVETSVNRVNDVMIKDAIRREISRRGQVFVVHNKVQTIYSYAENLQREIPEARIRVGHGQLPKEELEDILLDFWEQRFDVLVATTIIESGIDFPNANTLIVDNAQDFGLGQLYQLRGRIGRSDRQAYACFFYQESKMTPEARERLKAIATHTALGSGFRIAMQDLEIRGAGNILGKEQSGNMESVGFEMYTSMLREEILSLKGEKLEKPPEVSINLHLNAFIPDEYITDPEQKIEIYKKIARSYRYSELKAVMDECRDRFGDHPAPCRLLFSVAEVKCFCYALGISEIRLEGDFVRFGFKQDAGIDLNLLQKLLAKNHDLKFLPGSIPVLTCRVKGRKSSEILQITRKILEDLS